MSMLVQQDVIKGIVQKKRSSRKRPKQIPWVKAKTRENEASIPPGFLPKFITVKPEPFIDELEPEAFEASKQKGNVTTRPVVHDNCYLVKAQGHSSSMADNGGSVKMEFSMTSAQMAIDIKDQSEETARVRREATESQLECSMYSKDNISKNGESSSTFEVNMIASTLEVRVARLERIVSELNAAKKLGRNTSKEDS